MFEEGARLASGAQGGSEWGNAGQLRIHLRCGFWCISAIWVRLRAVAQAEPNTSALPKNGHDNQQSVAVWLAGVDDFEYAHAGKPDCYEVFELADWR
jgi:hypothetical protein